MDTRKKSKKFGGVGVTTKAHTKQHEKSLRHRELVGAIKRDKWLYLFLLPPLIYFFIFKYIPIFGTIIAFKDYKISKGIIDSAWVGFANFKKLFASSEFYLIFKNTILLNFYLLIFSFPFQIFLAICISEVRSSGFKRTVQSVAYIPHFISWAVLGTIVINIFSPSTGVVNEVIKLFGGEPIYFMANEKWWTFVYVISDVWQTAGWGTIVYLAAITNVDPELYEAGIIDGAGKLKRIIYITIPCIAPTIIIMLIMRVGRMLNMSFEQIWALQNDAVRKVSEVFVTYEYRNGIERTQYSYTTAVGLFKGVVALVLVTLTNTAARKFTDTSLW